MFLLLIRPTSEGRLNPDCDYDVNVLFYRVWLLEKVVLMQYSLSSK